MRYPSAAVARLRYVTRSPFKLTNERLARCAMATRPALFRQEAIDFLHQRRSWGEVVSLQPISSTILSWSLGGLIAFILCFLSVAQYTRKETVIGYLTPASGTAKI